MKLRDAARAMALAAGVAAGTGLAGCAYTPDGGGSSRVFAQGRTTVEVTRDGDRWTADYRFGQDAPIWAFSRSELIQEVRLPWRLKQWRVETPGVVLERWGAFDVLRSTDGGPAPREVRIGFTPAHAQIEGGYETLVFTTGAVALPTRQFDIFPVASEAALAAIPEDLNGVEVGSAPVVTWRDAAGPVLLGGERLERAVTDDGNGYVLFGQVEQVEGERLTTIMDPALPPWIGEQVGGFAPRVGQWYTRRLGPGQTDRPTVMISWNGPTEQMTSMGGSVMPGLITMSFEGAGVLNPTSEMLTVSRWFIGHESAHFWLGQTVRYEYARDAWITEGGADLMAVRALKALDPAYDDRAALQKEVDDCAELARGRSVTTAAQRGEQRAFYACGAVFAMAAEGAQRQVTGGDWLDFLKPLIDDNRRDGVLSREEWLDALTEVSRDPSLRLDVERLLDEGAADPAAVIARLFERTGVGFRMEAGRVVLV